MRCIATVAVGVVALSTSASAQDGRLKPALTSCMTQAVTHPLPQMLDVDNAAAVVYACEGQPALALFTAMEPVSNDNRARCDCATSGQHRLHHSLVPGAEHLHADY
jgi:hypothetical protein